MGTYNLDNGLCCKFHEAHRPDAVVGHNCALKAGHPGDHRCECGYSWPQAPLLIPLPGESRNQGRRL